MSARRIAPYLTLILGLAVGAFVARCHPAIGLAQSPQAPGNPQESRLLANLYMSTSAEYRACCLEIYKFAEERLAQKLRARSASAKPPAVVMDLDETVFDNSPFQTVLYRDRLEYRGELWKPWEQNFPLEVRLVPGAKRFIERAEAADVTVVYISNRMTQFSKSTIRALEHNGLNIVGIDKRLFLKDHEKDSDKEARRARARAQFDVLLLFGDNLRDFAEEFKGVPDGSVETRKQLVDANAAHWGDDWIVLPNCSYGDWERLIQSNPASFLPPTAMPNPEKAR